MRPGQRLVRRVQRSGSLLASWARHVRTAEDKRRALSELGTWAHTTFARVSMLTSEQPWLTFAATRFLYDYLTPNMRVFEWGSGGSTCALARRAGQVFSVEHDVAWHQRVLAHLADANLANVELRCVPADPEGTPGAEAYGSSSGKTFRSYVRAIDVHPDASLDLVIVDGRARLACTREALRKVRPTGVVLLDNAEREDVLPALSLFAAREWTRMDFDGPGPANIWPAFWRTTAFVRTR